jgi:hypothetical protein
MIGIARTTTDPAPLPQPVHNGDGTEASLRPRSIRDLPPPQSGSIAGVSRAGWWAVGFVLCAFGFQTALFFLGGIAAIRLPLRIGVYGLSVALMFIVKGRNRPHPAWACAQVAIALLAIETLDPSGDSWMSRGATIVLYASVLAPLVWVGRLALQVTDLRAVLRIMWAFYTLSATMGVLQVNYPGQFDGSLSANFTDRKAISFRMHVMTLGDGRKVIRPMGLTDVPGGAGNGGVNAIILGSGLLLTETNLIFRALLVAGMVGGLFCIFLVQERTSLIVVCLTTTTLAIVLARRKAIGRLLTLLSVAAAVTVVGTTVAFAVGGDAVVKRFATLTADNPTNVFQANRGQFLDELLHDDIYKYPFGAGLGHWGMLNGYFGSPAHGLWAEMLWQALDYDGGVPLMLVYVGIFALLLRASWQVAIVDPSSEVGTWAGVVVGYNLAAIGASFVFPIMVIQAGLEVVLLNACLYAVSKRSSVGQTSLIRTMPTYP